MGWVRGGVEGGDWGRKLELNMSVFDNLARHFWTYERKLKYPIDERGQNMV